MCYLVAKDVNNVGSIAWKTTHGEHLTDFKSLLEDKVGYDRIQLITISRPSAYGEYAPYHFVYTKEEFMNIVEKM